MFCQNPNEYNYPTYYVLLLLVVELVVIISIVCSSSSSNKCSRHSMNTKPHMPLNASFFHSTVDLRYIAVQAINKYKLGAKSCLIF